MATAAHSPVADDFFSFARDHFETTLAWLQSDQAPTDHADTERRLQREGSELMRRLYQGFLDRCAGREPRRPGETGTVVRLRTRGLESSFGRVRVARLAYTRPGSSTEFPRDQSLNLPPDLYSLPLREQVAVEATRGSFDQVVERLETAGGARVPKRQAEELVERAARDVDAFYALPHAANDPVSAQGLLVLTSDSKGVTMRPEALRDATRKAAASQAAHQGKADPMATKKARKHDKRMAIVTAVYEQEPFARTAGQVVAMLRRPVLARGVKAKPPPVEHKRVRASVQKSQTRAIAELFDEADRRDPGRERTTVALVDGEERQLREVQRQARKRDRAMTTIVDVLHVLHYLWGAANALCGGKQGETEAWVRTYLLKLLMAKTAIDVAAGIRQAATLRGVRKGQSKAVDRCVRYLRNNAPFLRYRDALDQGFPIATGVIEGACRHLVQDRMGITGAKWGLQGAEAVLKLRAVKANGDWDAYWRFHEEEEGLRNYPRKTP